GRHGSITMYEAPKAIIAGCKVRTEVQEVTRAMHDISNAHFMLWPPCVEVQRCSGCCNSQIMHCVPTITSTRDLEVVKIQYLNSKPQIGKAIVSVEDHLSCRCEQRAHPRRGGERTTPSSPSPRRPPSPAQTKAHRV
uniref:Platelet-derived growth factor subunit B n=1 Tax=Gadus morhua TaxID=8049 RepID=A0A8C4ZBK9_GADMO